MREQFLLLTALQEIDAHLHDLNVAQAQLPQRLHQYEHACSVAQQHLTQQQTLLEQCERHQRALEREVSGQQETLTKTQRKLHEVKTNKEYSAILAEIAAGQHRLDALEDELLHLFDTIDAQRQACHAQAQSVQDATQVLAEQATQLTHAQELLRQEALHEQEKRQQTVSHLEPSLYATYQKLQSQRPGRVVAYVQQDVCSACHLMVRPQLISEIRLQQQLYTCPHCRLILLWPS